MAKELSNDNSFKSDMAQVRKFGESLDTSTTGSTGNETSNTIGADFKNAASSQAKASQSLEKAETYRLAAGSTESGTSGIQFNPSQAWVNSKGSTPESAAQNARQFLQTHTPAQIMNDMSQFMQSDAGMQAIKQAIPNFHDNSKMNSGLKGATGGLPEVPTSTNDLNETKAKYDAGVVQQNGANRAQIPGSATASPTVTVTSTNATTGEPTTQVVTPTQVRKGAKAAQAVVDGKIMAGGNNLDTQYNNESDKAVGKLDHLANSPLSLAGQNSRNVTQPGNTQSDILDEMKGKK